MTTLAVYVLYWAAYIFVVGFISPWWLATLAWLVSAVSLRCIGDLIDARQQIRRTRMTAARETLQEITDLLSSEDRDITPLALDISCRLDATDPCM
jgi:hypothetical protein